jgi:hypothetical protein
VWFEGVDVGADNTPLDDQYAVSNKFTGSIDQVVFHSSEMKLTAEEKREYLPGVLLKFGDL